MSSSKSFIKQRVQENFFKKKTKLKVRARSFFKLEEIDEKFNLIKSDISILDLGCAPGSWIEFIDKKLKGFKFKLIGIDLLDVRRAFEFSNNVTILKCDFFDFDTKDFFDLILSDMAIEFSGNLKKDKGLTHNLNYSTIRFCDVNLKKNGNLVFKTFYGEEYDNILKEVKKKFKKVVEYKPRSSQTKTPEIFMICLNKL